MPLQNRRRVESAQEVMSIPVEDRVLYDSRFSREYARQMTQQRARRKAQRDLDDEESIAAHAALASLPIEEVNARMGVIDWGELWADETEEHWLVPGFISASRGHMLYAPSGLGKSLACLEVAASLACGRGIWGAGSQPPVRVLYLDQENSPLGDIRPRLMAMGFHHEDLKNLTYLSFPEMGPLNHRDGGSTLATLLDLYHPDFVFFDTFSRFVDADENLAKTVQDFYNWTGRTLKKRGIGYMRLDHTGKNTSVGARGTSAKTDDLDLIWAMSEGRDAGTFTLTNEKQRVPVPNSAITLERLESPLRHRRVGASIWTSLLAELAKFEAVIDLVRGLHERDPKHSLGLTKTWVELREQCKAIGASRQNLFDAIKFFKEHELVEAV
jgi:hypothetical protein